MIETCINVVGNHKFLLLSFHIFCFTMTTTQKALVIDSSQLPTGVVATIGLEITAADGGRRQPMENAQKEIQLNKNNYKLCVSLEIQQPFVQKKTRWILQAKDHQLHFHLSQCYNYSPPKLQKKKSTVAQPRQAKFVMPRFSLNINYIFPECKVKPFTWFWLNMWVCNVALFVENAFSTPAFKKSVLALGEHFRSKKGSDLWSNEAYLQT